MTMINRTVRNALLDFLQFVILENLSVLDLALSGVKGFGFVICSLTTLFGLGFGSGHAFPR